MVILVSRCLLGERCRYDGGHCRDEGVLEGLRGHEVVPVCPELSGGLQTPRPPCERSGDKVFSARGEDLTAAFSEGAEATLRLARESGADLCVLKARSPSCGVGRIYDGRFTGTLTKGNGVAAEALLAAGFTVVNEEDARRILAKK